MPGADYLQQAMFLENDSDHLSLNVMKKSVIDDQLKKLEHKIQAGENLTRIAKKYNTTVSEIQKANNIKDINKVYVNQKLIIPAAVGKPTSTSLEKPSSPKTNVTTSAIELAKNNSKKHIVQKGDSLQKIANQYNTPLASLMRVNNITDPDTLLVGTVLLVDTAPIIAQQQLEKKKEETYIDFAALQSTYEKINAKNDKDKVIDYNKINPQWNYIIIDKTNAVLQVYDADGKMLTEFIIGLGKNKWDAITINSEDDRDNNVSGAGIYKINMRSGQSKHERKIYEGNSFVTENEKGVLQGMAIHQIPTTHKERYAMMKTGNPEDRRYSNGCINLTQDDFKKLATYINVGSGIYVLPEETGNHFVVKDGKLQFTTTDLSKDFGKYNYSPKDKEPKGLDYTIKNKEYNTPIAQKFMQSLIDKKADLMRDVGLGNDEYNNICKVCFGILGQESEFGEGYEYYVKERAQGLVSWAKKQRGNNSANSRWLTQIKPVNIDKDPILQKYKITSESLNDPANAAIATLVVIGKAYKELKGLRQAGKIKLPINDQNIYDYVVYMYYKRSEIYNNTATPEKNKYVKHIKEYTDGLSLMQKDSQRRKTTSV